jgi:2-keto-3-deoxygluconate permease
MKILKTVQKVPGGLIIVPLFTATIINSFFPQVLKIGGITTATFSTGTLAFIGCILLCVGSQINTRGAVESFKRGGVLVAAKFLAGFIPALIITKMFGINGFLGLTPLMLMAGATSINSGIYLGLMGTIGDEYDMGANALLSLATGPFFTLIGLGAAGIASFNGVAMLASVGTMLVGFILGNLDDDIRNFLKGGVVLMLPFIGFCLGANLNVISIAKGGPVGIALGLLTVALSFVFMVPADKFLLRRPGYAAAANCSSGGSAVAVPAIIAQVSSNYAGQVAAATTAIAASAIITAILCPLLTTLVVRRWGSARTVNQEEVVRNGDKELQGAN